MESKEKTPALNKCPGVGPGRRIKTGQSGGQYQEVSFTLTVLKNNHMKRFQHREILEKCKLKHSEVSPTLVRMAFVKSLQTINAGEDVEKREPSYTDAVKVNC